MAAGNSGSLIGTVVAERYRIEQLLGQGGMGTVYRAQHVRMQKTVAIKILHQQMTTVEEVVKRFEREAIAASRISHPNVAAASDFGHLDNGSLYLVLEYVAGHGLSKLLAKRALPVERAAFIASQIAAALAAAHAVGIVHRDLKPDNVMLIEKDGTGDFVKVLDFGIAKLDSRTAQAGTQLTVLGSVFGTPRYMAPEQAAGKVVDHRADLYALGLIMYEMLAGQPAFDSHEMIALLMKQMTEAPPPLPAHIPAELRDLVMELLRKEPEERPRDAKQVVQRIEAWARTRAPSSPTPPVSSRVGSQAVSLLHGAPAVAGKLLALAKRPFVKPKRNAVLHSASVLTKRHVLPRARKLWAVAQRRSVKRVPNWVFAAVALVLLAVLLLRSSPQPEASPLMVPSAKPGPSAKAETKQPPESGDDDEEEAENQPTPAEELLLDPELRRVLDEARRGGTSALYALEQRPEGERSKHEWLALAQGRLKQRQVTDSLKAYEKALEIDATLSGDARMMSGLRYFAEKESTYETVLEFAAEHMGEPGADLIFHVWATTSRITPYTQKAKDLLEDADVRKHMSTPLRLAMQLRDAAFSCDDAKKLLPQILTEADDRTLMRLKEMSKTDGCGADKKDDCYPCLRDSSLLKDAITQVQMRGQPRFGRRRWR